MTNKHDGGKGDAPRPLGVDQKTFENNWDAIFNKKPEKCIKYELEADNDHIEIKANIPL
jgi:hypothetical protein